MCRKVENRRYTTPVLGKGVAIGLAAVALVPSGAKVTPPSQPGPWKQIGASATSRIGHKLHVLRIVTASPKALAFVVTSRSSRRMHVAWFTYCEFESDDVMTEEHSGTLNGVRRLTAYPSVFDQATDCNLSFTVSAVKGARVTAAVFAY
jgi:hypothetical protein